MGYVKISDPNIIDLNAIHNIINVVNQHSDTLNTLTNNFGANNNTTPVSYNTSNTLERLFDTGSQMILYGRAMFDSSFTATNSTSPAGKIYNQTVAFSTSDNGMPNFGSASPIVFLTVHTGNSSTVSTKYPDARVNVYSPSATSFKIRLFLQETIASSDKIYVDWIAIGPKSK